QHTEELTNSLLREQHTPDLVIWPETTFPNDWLAVAPGTQPGELPERFPIWDRSIREMIDRVAKYSRANILLGLNTRQYSGQPNPRRFNSAVLVCKDVSYSSKTCAPQRYDKIHCVPFGEYIPMKDTMPWMSVFSPYDHEYSLTPGDGLTRFTLPTRHGEFR